MGSVSLCGEGVSSLELWRVIKCRGSFDRPGLSMTMTSYTEVKYIFQRKDSQRWELAREVISGEGNFFEAPARAGAASLIDCKSASRGVVRDW